MSQRAVFGLVLAMVVGFSMPAFAARGAAKGAANAGPVERIREAISQVNLTSDQQPQVDKILDDARQQVGKLRAEAKASGDRQAAREKAKDIMKDTIGKLSHVLTPEQRGKLREIIKQSHAEKKSEKAPATQPAATN